MVYQQPNTLRPNATFPHQLASPMSPNNNAPRKSIPGFGFAGGVNKGFTQQGGGRPPSFPWSPPQGQSKAPYGQNAQQRVRPQPQFARPPQGFAGQPAMGGWGMQRVPQQLNQMYYAQDRPARFTPPRNQELDSRLLNSGPRQGSWNGPMPMQWEQWKQSRPPASFSENLDAYQSYINQNFPGWNEYMAGMTQHRAQDSQQGPIGPTTRPSPYGPPQTGWGGGGVTPLPNPYPPGDWGGGPVEGPPRGPSPGPSPGPGPRPHALGPGGMKETKPAYQGGYQQPAGMPWGYAGQPSPQYGWGGNRGK
jgi:hypothetical protein